MTYEEAIQELKYMISEDCTENRMDFVEEIEFAIECIEKQIPKKPIKVRCTNGRFSYLCPMCNIGLSSMCGCQNNGCGQAIDWSVD